MGAWACGGVCVCLRVKSAAGGRWWRLPRVCVAAAVGGRGAGGGLLVELSGFDSAASTGWSGKANYNGSMTTWQETRRTPLGCAVDMSAKRYKRAKLASSSARASKRLRTSVAGKSNKRPTRRHGHTRPSGRGLSSPQARAQRA